MMSNETLEEVNKYIAEFMVIYRLAPNYCGDLNLLVPVWKKIHDLTLWNIEISSDTMDAWEICFHHFGVSKVEYESPLNEPLAKAAARATYKAIKALE